MRTKVKQVILFYLMCELTLTLGAPFNDLSDLDVLTLIDPVTQFEEDSEPKKVVVKSVFNVPVKITPTLPPCPDGQRRVTENGPCVPHVSNIKLGDQFLLQSFSSLYHRRRPTTSSASYPSGSRRRKTTPAPTTKAPSVLVPTYVIEEVDQQPNNLVPLTPFYSNSQNPTSDFPTPSSQNLNAQHHVNTTIGTTAILPEPTTETPTQSIEITSATPPTSAISHKFNETIQLKYTTESVIEDTTESLAATTQAANLPVENKDETILVESEALLPELTTVPQITGIDEAVTMVPEMNLNEANNTTVTSTSLSMVALEATTPTEPSILEQFASIIIFEETQSTTPTTVDSTSLRVPTPEADPMLSPSEQPLSAKMFVDDKVTEEKVADDTIKFPQD